jgi:3-deoxy-manno-octulosonate cytidylyltransferase (CMP-KDO synthetase)
MIVAVIPARYASTRLPGKPLLAETGKPLIQHVYESIWYCADINRVIVATDDERIFQAVKGFGGEVVMTSPSHKTGTDRIAEVVKNLDYTRIINIQGDEPEIEPWAISAAVEALEGSNMSTVATPFENPQDVVLSSRVKVAVDNDYNAMYFTRAPIPGLLHLGIYGYTKEFLLHYVTLKQTRLEQLEKLEQLRALEHGYKIKVGIIKTTSHGGIDTPNDYAEFVRRHKRM